MVGIYHGVFPSKRQEVLTVVPPIELTWEEGKKTQHKWDRQYLRLV